jgi:hypothetical protein
MKKAFSLIELSIVILTIGIIIAGVTQSSALLQKAKIQSALTLTKNSPVAGIEGLSFWFETTLPESFLSDQTEEGKVITQWNDINPQNSNKFYLSSYACVVCGQLLNQFYSESAGPGGLPSIYLNGDPDPGILDMISDKPTDAGGGNPAGSPDKNQTFFLVYKTAAYLAYGDRTWQIALSPDTSYAFRNNADNIPLNDGVSNVSSNPEIISVTFGGADNQFNSYVNGSNVASDYLWNGTGSGSFGIFGWESYVSEIIFYDHILKDEERQSIEQYLGSKYGIEVVKTATPAPTPGP